MNSVRELCKRYECDEGVLWVLPAESHLKAQMVDTALEVLQPFDTNAEKTGNHIINNARGLFRIIEAYVLDAEWKTDNTIADYWHAREGKPLTERWELWTILVKASQWGFLIDAWQATRPREIMSQLVEIDEKKES